MQGGALTPGTVSTGTGGWGREESFSDTEARIAGRTALTCPSITEGLAWSITHPASAVGQTFVVYACSLFLFPLNSLNEGDQGSQCCTISNVVHCLPLRSGPCVRGRVVLERGATAPPCVYAFPSPLESWLRGLGSRFKRNHGVGDLEIHAFRTS